MGLKIIMVGKVGWLPLFFQYFDAGDSERPEFRFRPNSGIFCLPEFRFRKVLLESGINISIYKLHSTRVASVSTAKADSVDVNEILKTAGWTNNRSFEIFYNKIIQNLMILLYGVELHRS